MWYLVLYLNAYQVGSSIAILPEKYSTEEACHLAAKADKWQHSCIPAPKTQYNCTTSKSNGDGTYSAVPSICNPPSNYIGNMPKCYIGPNGNLECNKKEQ